MARRIEVKYNGLNKLPIIDGTYETSDSMDQTETGTLTVAFYDVDDNIVTPDAGSIGHAMMAMDQQWFGASSGDSPIDATLCGGDAGYTIPVYNGPTEKGRVTFTGITGATIAYAKAVFWRA